MHIGGYAYVYIYIYMHISVSIDVLVNSLTSTRLVTGTNPVSLTARYTTASATCSSSPSPLDLGC